MPVTPKYDENKIIEVLHIPSSAPDAPKLVAAAIWCLMDAYDRQLPRDEYEGIVEHALKLVQYLSRLQVTTVLQNMQNRGTLDQNAMCEAILGCIGRGEVERKALLTKMELIAQMPWEGDAIH